MTNLPPAKRTDVGYKRPPPEHQFKKGQKPPPRRPKAPPPSTSPRATLHRILNQVRWADINGRRVRMTTGELILRVADQTAERTGNAALRRLLIQLDFRNEPVGHFEPEPVIIDDWSGSDFAAPADSGFPSLTPGDGASAEAPAAGRTASASQSTSDPDNRSEGS